MKHARKSKVEIILIVFFLFCNFSLVAQTKATIINMDNQYQKCLDEEADMLRCSQNYYTKMDSMLNVVYRQVITKYPQRKLAIKNEQIKWLKTRDKQFADIDREHKEQGLSSYDNQMIVIDKKSQLVRQRVLELIEILNSE